MTDLRLSAANRIQGIPWWIGELTLLRYLYLSTNQLDGPIPESVGNLAQLEHLFLHTNNLSGTIPSSLEGLVKLKYLYLNLNDLTGTVPPSLGKMSQLERLIIDNNALEGNIPSALGKLSKLIFLYVHANKFTGALPDSLGYLNSLYYFMAGSNQLTGSIPASFSNLRQIRTFDVSFNQLSGDLPSGLFTNWPYAATIYLDRNAFSGPFPDVSGLTVIRNLRFHSNQITSVPASLQSRSALDYLYMQQNRIKELPDFSSHVDKANLRLYVQENELGFDQIQPMIGAGIYAFTYAPQKEVTDVSSITLAEGQPLVLSSRPLGPASSVVWQRQSPGGAWETLANDEDTQTSTYTRNAATATDEGVYRWQMTDAQITSFTLTSCAIAVKSATRFTLDNWAFQYQYDGRRRMIGKKVPGADWVWMVYDDRDRLVLTQDGEQRKVNKWTFTKYVCTEPSHRQRVVRSWLVRQPG
ncbi:MAG: hypothetical protein ACOYXA_06095 [Bacteroidota bacterium]